MFATRPPGRHDPRAEVERLPGTPTASIATSTPCAAGDVEDLLLGVVAAVRRCASAPKRSACASREAREVDRDDPPAPAIAAVMIAASPTGPRADDGDRVARLHAAVLDADLEAGGQDVGEEEHLLVGDAARARRAATSRVGHARELRLHAVDQVAEDPADPADRLAVRGHAALARPAAAARRDGGDEDAVALGEAAHRRAALDDRADRLVPEDAALGDGRDVALEDVQVRAADRRRVATLSR